jgi:NAD(P)-dependent dehydrogenase (short-subunit alcohol dehydrogenase family)
MGELTDKTVLVAGVGPGLGRSIALAAAREGASVVLAARTESRLVEIAKEIEEAGGRAHAVMADVTDPDAGARLADAARAEYGEVHCLAYNALVMPPIKPLMAVDTEVLAPTIEQNAVAALRLTRALESGIESIVYVNSMVMRFSQLRMGPYKMAKSALHAIASSLATELGPRGIRVNSVAPGHIWGDSLQWYFSYLAHKRNVDPQVIYDETAEATDLKRLVLPDEIAEAVVFLLSDRARAITGQCLDVNCGEFHH